MGAPERKSNTAIWIVIYLVILIATTSLGLLLGLLYHRMAPAKYRCDAAFRVVDHPAMLGTVSTIQHDQRISQPEFVESVLKSNKLFELRCFDDFPKEQAVKDTVANLEVIQNKKEESIYEVSLFSHHPDDAKQIVDHLIAQYRQELDQATIPASESESPEPSDSSLQPPPNIDPSDLAKLEFVKRIQNSGHVPVGKLQLIQPATHGRQVWPILSVILGVAGAIGLLTGLALIIFIFLVSRGLRLQSAAE